MGILDPILDAGEEAFGQFVDDFITVYFNQGEVYTAVNTYPFSQESDKFNLLNRLYLESIMRGVPFTALLKEETVNSPYRNLLRDIKKLDDWYASGPVATSFIKGYQKNTRPYLYSFASTHIPQEIGADLPYGPAKQNQYIQVKPEDMHRVIDGPWKLPNYLLSEFWHQYDFVVDENNLLYWTYGKGTWVSIAKIEVHLPGSAADYRPDFFEYVGHPLYRVIRDTALSNEQQNFFYDNIFEYVWYPDEPLPGEERPLAPENDPDSPDYDPNAPTPPPPMDPYAVITYEWIEPHTGTDPEPTPEERYTTDTFNYFIPLYVFEVSDVIQMEVYNTIYWGTDIYHTLIGPDTGLIAPQTKQSVKFQWAYVKGSGFLPEWDNLTTVIGTSSSDTGYLEIADVEYVSSAYIPKKSDYDLNEMLDPDNLVDSKEEYRYTRWKYQCEIFGLDPYQLLKDLKVEVDLTNSLSAAVDMGIPFNTEDRVLMKYVQRIIDNWYQAYLNIPLKFINNRDRVTATFDFRFSAPSVSFGFSCISRETRYGQIYNDPSYKRGMWKKEFDYWSDTIYDDLRAQDYTGTWEGMIFQYQIEDNKYYIYRLGAPVASYDSLRGQYFGIGIMDDRFVLPIHLKVANTLPSLEFQYVMHKALRITQVLAVQEDITWMQTASFQNLMDFVGKAMIVTSAIGGIGSLMITLSIGLLPAIILYGAISWGTKKIIDFAIEELGPKDSAILAGVLVLTGAALGVAGGTEVAMVGAQLLMSTANGLMSAVNEEKMDEVKKSYQQLEYEREEFGEYYEESVKELEEAQSLLNIDNQLNPYLFIGKIPMHVWGESPDSFYERTIHSGNIGAKSFDFITNFVDDKLKLPNIDDTVGDKLYV